jgi:hypothetical protein
MKIKTCPHCGEPLACKACGRLHTPRKEKHNKRAMSFRMDEESANELERISEESGESMTTVLETAIRKCAEETDPRD